MPRRPRLIVPGTSVHVIHRGRLRRHCFRADDDYLLYLGLLTEHALPSGCLIHAYALMPTHVQLLFTPLATASASIMMKQIGQRYTDHANRSYGWQGPLWGSRFRSRPVQSGAHLLLCQQEIELNPVRNGLVTEPGAYRWTSFRANRHGESSDIVMPHPDYRQLGATDDARQEAYGDLFRDDLAKTGTIDYRSRKPSRPDPFAQCSLDQTPSLTADTTVDIQKSPECVNGWCTYQVIASLTGLR